jgi:hypothetical protein
VLTRVRQHFQKLARAARHSPVVIEKANRILDLTHLPAQLKLSADHTVHFVLCFFLQRQQRFFGERVNHVFWIFSLVEHAQRFVNDFHVRINRAVRVFL